MSLSALLLSADSGAAAAPLLRLFGRLHPLVVHAPLGAMGLLLLLELTHLRRGLSLGLRVCAYAFLAGTSLASLASGWVLAGTSGAGGTLLTNHKTAAIVAAALSVPALGASFAQRTQLLRRILLLLTIGALAATGHFGGSMVHGEDWLDAAPPSASPPLSPLSAESSSPSPAWPAEVEAFFTAYCNACHGERMQKGGLRTDSPTALTAGGRSGPAWVPGELGASELWRRLELPPEDEEHMPPPKKAQPSEAERERVRRWIEESAPERGQAPPPKHGASPVPLGLRKHPVVAAMLAQGVAVTALDAEDREWEVRFDAAEIPDPDAALQEFAPVAIAVRSLRLARSNVGEAGLAEVRSWPNLRRLDLSRTQLKSFAPLREHPALEVIVAVENRLPAAALDDLLTLPKLRTVYWFGNEFPEPRRRELAASHPGVAIVSENSGAPDPAPLEPEVRLSSEAPPPGVPRALHPENQECPIDQKPAQAAYVLMENLRPTAFCSLKCMQTRLEQRARAEEAKK